MSTERNKQTTGQLLKKKFSQLTIRPIGTVLRSMSSPRDPPIVSPRTSEGEFTFATLPTKQLDTAVDKLFLDRIVPPKNPVSLPTLARIGGTFIYDGESYYVITHKPKKERLTYQLCTILFLFLTTVVLKRRISAAREKLREPESFISHSTSAKEAPRLIVTDDASFNSDARISQTRSVCVFRSHF